MDKRMLVIGVEGWMIKWLVKNLSIDEQNAFS